LLDSLERIGESARSPKWLTVAKYLVLLLVAGVFVTIARLAWKLARVW
jgi:hypothetical protein